MRRRLTRLFVTAAPTLSPENGKHLGRLRAGPAILRCALGRAGIRPGKREGDLATPAGSFRLERALFRRDRLPRPASALAIRELKPSAGWCDDPASPLYNRAVILPCPARHEDLWRADPLYDLVIVVGYNRHPRRKHLGSAIFIHCARADFGPTEGCIALKRDDLRRLLPRLARHVVVRIR